MACPTYCYRRCSHLNINHYHRFKGSDFSSGIVWVENKAKSVVRYRTKIAVLGIKTASALDGKSLGNDFLEIFSQFQQFCISKS